jgi:sugar O-acyltransferase (sialic acid O-acetyltransferase NeuD family)
MAQSFVFFATGSSISSDYAASCRRLGVKIAAGIANRAGPSFLPADVPILGPGEIDTTLLATPCICPLFTPSNRRIAAQEALQLGFAFGASLIDPTAIVADDLEDGGGCFLNAGVIIGACTVLGSQVVINRGASIGHHGRIGDYASLGPGAILAGEVTVGAGAMIGAGAIVLPQMTIGEGAIVGAGAIVTRPVPPGAKVMGQAARAIEPPQDAQASKSA